MSIENESTLSAYNVTAQAYVTRDSMRNRAGFYEQWIKDSFMSLGKNARILEIGSAYGRDANYLLEMGYDVQTSDASTAFLDPLKQRGFSPVKLDIINQAPSRAYDAVYASAVFLHFTKEDFRIALKNVAAGLNLHGKFVFSLIEGDGEKNSTSLGAQRYFYYWQADSLRSMLAGNGFTVLDMKKDAFEDQSWLYIVAEKREENK